MSFYALVAHLKAYINPEGTKNLVTICSRIAKKWLNKLKYRYQHIEKNVFVDSHEQSNVVENRKKFVKTIEKMEFYLVEFDTEGKMFSKAYPSDCTVEREIRCLIIIITYDECTFSSNNGP